MNRIVILSLLIGCLSIGGLADAEPNREATAALAEGTALLTQSDFEGALEAFKTAARKAPGNQDYAQQYGNPPDSLENLVPDFLPTVPQTGMGAYPEYEYKVGDEALKFTGNSWCLMVQTSQGLLNWDIFIYFPNQDYPKRGYGGVLEKVGDWAYVHE